MTAISLLPADLGTAPILLERAYAEEGSPLTAEKARSLEVLTEMAVTMGSDLQMAWRACSQEGSVWETGSYVSRIRTVDYLAATTVDFLTRTEEILTRTREEHPEWVPPQKISQVKQHLPPAREVVAKSRDLLQWLNRKRPPGNEDMLRRSQESLDRGEGEALNDIAGLGNGDPLLKE